MRRLAEVGPRVLGTVFKAAHTRQHPAMQQRERLQYCRQLGPGPRLGVRHFGAAVADEFQVAGHLRRLAGAVPEVP